MKKMNSFIEGMMDDLAQDIQAALCKTNSDHDNCLPCSMESIHLKTKIVTLHTEHLVTEVGFKVQDTVVVKYTLDTNRYELFGTMENITSEENSTLFQVKFTSIKRIFIKRNKQELLPRYKVKIVTKRSSEQE